MTKATGTTAQAPQPRKVQQPTLLVIRAAEAPDTTPVFAARTRYLAKVRTLAWSGVLTARSLTALIAERLADRPLVLFAEGEMAAAALAATSPEIRSVVAVDPGSVAELPRRRADVILSRPDASPPAFAGEPGVRLHRTAPGFSKNEEELALLISEVCREACRHAWVEMGQDDRLLDTALLDATPMIPGDVGYLGPEGEAFVSAYRSRRPDSRPRALLDGGKAGPLDVLVLAAPLALEDLRAAAAALRPGGWLVARWRPSSDVPYEVRDLLASLGLRIAGPVDSGGTFIFRAQRASDPEPARMIVMSSTYSPWLMDIRTRLPFQQIGSDPEVFVRYVTPLANIPPAPLDQPKIAIMQRPARTDPDNWLQIMSRLIVKGWVCALEYDDHPYLVADVAGIERGEHLLRFFGYVHAVQTSVEPLGELFRRYNPEVAVFANAVFNLLPFPSSAPRRVFYGATPRGELPAEVARSLAPVIAQFPDTEFVSVGGATFIDALPTNRKTLYEYTSYEAYLELMASCSVSLAPIEASALNEMKSDAKFLDASRAGVLTIASPTIYDRTIRHGENGLIAREIGDWSRLLTDVLSNPETGRSIARRAWEEARDSRMFHQQLPERKAWYQSLWARREALTEAAMERLPGLREKVARLRG